MATELIEFSEFINSEAGGLFCFSWTPRSSQVPTGLALARIVVTSRSAVIDLLSAFDFVRALAFAVSGYVVSAVAFLCY